MAKQAPYATTARLDRAHEQRDLVRLESSIDSADPTTGYVVAVGTDWVLLSLVADSSPDGWVALRRDDIASIDSAPGGRFVQRGLESQRNWPPRPPATRVPLSDGTSSLLAFAAGSSTLVTLYEERANPHGCLVGRPLSYTGERLEWRQLSSDGDWESPSSACRLSDITRVEFGGQYQLALAHVSYLRSLLDLDLDRDFRQDLDQDLDQDDVDHGITG